MSEFENKLKKIASEIRDHLDPKLNYSEYCYQNLLLKLYLQLDDCVKTEVPIMYWNTDRTIQFGHGRVDLVVETEAEVFLIELKANTNKLRAAELQLAKYVHHYKHNTKSTKKIVGLLFMFNYRPCRGTNHWDCFIRIQNSS